MLHSRRATKHKPNQIMSKKLGLDHISLIYGRFGGLTGGISLIYGRHMWRNPQKRTPEVAVFAGDVPYISEKPHVKTRNVPYISET